MVDCAYVHNEMPMAVSPSYDAYDSCVSEVEMQTEEWVQSPSKPSFQNTIIIFDWDDTLLSSSWLSSNGLYLYSELTHEAVDQLKVLEAAVIKLINKALQFGEVYLVTNAENGWVELSAEKFLPGVVSLLPKVNIVSARSSYQSQFPNQPFEWKVEAFRSGLEQVFQDRADFEEKSHSMNSCRNVISFGDSMHERLALRRVTSNMPNTYSKSVKFVERPTIEQLERELTIINSSFDYLCTYSGDLDLMLVVEMLCN